MSAPAPAPPAHPALSGALFRRWGGARPSGIAAVRHRRNVTRARMAFALALADMGAGPGWRVLMPAYHCTALVEPVVHRGAEPVWFRVNADLTPDWDDVEAKAAGARAVVAIHYFGFPQDMDRWRSLADRHGLVLVEDCAHALYGTCGGRPLGAHGDYAIASFWRFQPVRDGGCLA